MNEETVLRLGKHLRDLWREHIPPEVGEFDQAKHILADPQGHIDALVEAGVLERLGTWGAEPSGRHITAYGVVQPHVHDWRVIGPTQADSVSQVLVGCGCGNKHWVLNRLPIEVPDD